MTLLSDHPNYAVVYRPEGQAFGPSMLHVESCPAPTVETDRLLVATRFLSLDPYMLRALSGQGDRRFEAGSPMHGRVIGQVLASSNTRFPVGCLVLGEGPWQSRSMLDPAMLEIVTGRDEAGIAACLGVVGTPGLTAWLGMQEIARPAPGQHVLVSSAAGAIGGAAGQIAKIAGARVTGIAGGRDKVACVTGTLGFDNCLDRHDRDFDDQLAALAPVDIFFDNVGGALFDRMIAAMAPDGKMLICGQIASYGSGAPQPMTNFRHVLERRLQIIGFGVSRIGDRKAAAVADLTTWHAQGRLTAKTNVVDGLENAPAALFALLVNGAVGKTVVRLS